MKKNDIGMVGLAVMGSNLALNMASHGFNVSVWNYTDDLTEIFINGAASGNDRISAFYDLKDFTDSLEKPRKVFLMIQAGSPVDSMIDRLLPILEKGDIIIDGGNSNFEDTMRRCKTVEDAGLLYIGTGVSGGEEGALHGPAMMPGGSKEAWEAVKTIFQSICAKADDGVPCCGYVGENGAGHFVKMVHNGIEYGDMQLICESYQFMKDVLGYTNEKMHGIFEGWNEGELKSYLIQITSEILDHKEEDGSYTVDKILDSAGQKGTGKWTGINALNEGVPLTLIAEAVFARCLSAIKQERITASKLFETEKPAFTGSCEEMTEDLRKALYLSKIISYAQGYTLMRSAAKTYHWELNYGGIATMWRGGCIIRSAFLSKIKEAYDKEPGLQNILLDDYFTKIVKDYVPSLRRVAAAAAIYGIPMPAFTSALSWFDGYTTERLPQNLLQAQRDYFGAHTYEILGQEGHFHTNWTEESGSITSTVYGV